MIRVDEFLPKMDRGASRELLEKVLAPTVASMEGSRILAAASDARILKATGVEVCDLTVGDYAPEQFRAPDSFLHDLVAEIRSGRNQYPPSDGLPELQKAVLDLYERELGIRFPERSVVICGGARPPIYALFRALVPPGNPPFSVSKVTYPVPSWNNDYYTLLCGGQTLPIQTSAQTNFMPTVDQVVEAISDKSVRMFCLNSPLNPCGTVISRETLEGICQELIAENRKRLDFGWHPVFFLFDQVYWPLTSEPARFHHPLEVVPELAPWTIYVDAISKWMVGTGLRLGWAVVPPYLYEPVRDLMGHIGGWAPRAVQAATAKFLSSPKEFTSFKGELKGKIEERLQIVDEAFKSMRAEGLPVDIVSPQGAIYTSVQFGVIGKRASSGKVLTNNTEIRKYLLAEARVALVPFQAFGMNEETGWFRISVGAVSSESLHDGLRRLREAIISLSD